MPPLDLILIREWFMAVGRRMEAGSVHFTRAVRADERDGL